MGRIFAFEEDPEAHRGAQIRTQTGPYAAEGVGVQEGELAVGDYVQLLEKAYGQHYSHAGSG